MAVLKGTDFGDANLRNTNFVGAFLIDADFKGADLEGSDLSGTYLQGANLRARSLKDVNFRGAVYDDKTVWPGGFDPIKAGATKTATPTLPAPKPARNRTAQSPKSRSSQ
jgi:uncharacterized protein YjbI with pentapeptide repeats